MAKSSLFRLSYRQKFKFFQKKTVFWLVSLFVLGLYQPATVLAETGHLAAEPVDLMTLPDDELISLSGQKLSFEAYHGKTALLINFWATWCGPCVVELPELEEAAQKLKAEGIEVALISVDRKGLAHAQAFLDERAITTPLSFHSSMAEWPRAFGLRGLPSSLLISADQTEIYLVQGAASWADEDVLHQIKTLIAP